MTEHLRCAGLAVLFVAGLVVCAVAQTNTGEIGGIVRDASGAVLPHALVTARHVAAGLTVQRMTDAAGRYFLPALRTGHWDVAASLAGFSTQTRTGILVELGRTIEIEFTLGVGGVADAITVAADPPLLQSHTAEISDVISNQRVLDLPLNGRQFLALAQLSDAVVLPPGGTRGEALQQAGPLPNIGGQRSGHNIYLLDGAKVTDELFNNLVINPSIDSIQEFKIQKSMYPAEFGGKASALINVATRSGANAVHGSAFEFLRDEALDARNSFDPADAPTPPLDQHQFGGALGGPVVRDRAFFFVSYEGQRMDRSLTRTFSVPSDAVRAGSFAGMAPICDPLTRDAATGSCTPFADNRIPDSRIDPVARAFLEHVPRATSTTPQRNLTAVETLTRRLDQVSARLDWRLSGVDQLFARVSTFDADERQPFGTSVLQETLTPGFGRTLDTTTRNVSVSHTRTVGSSLVNEFRVGWLDVTGGQHSVNRGVDFAAKAGLLGVTSDPRDVGFPQIATGGLYSIMGDPTSFVTRRNRHLELVENVTLDRGAHRVKFGAYYFHLRLRPEQPDNARGAFTFTGQFTGNAFADFLLGYPTSASVGAGRGDEDGRTNWLHLYVQDDWRVRSNLTLNLGLRYEYNQHMVDANNRLSSIDLGVPGGRFVVASDARGTISPDAQAMLPLIPIPYVTSAEAGWERGLLSPSAVRLAPRTGFALGFDDGKGVVRGGYGVFLNQWAYSVQTAFARNLPFFVTKQIDVPADVRVPTLQTRDILAASTVGAASASIMDHDYRVEWSQTWSGGVQYELFPKTLVEVAYMGTWTLGADNATVRNVPEPGPGPIQARRPIPQLSRINAIRFDGKSIYHGLTFKTERRTHNGLAWSASYTLSTSKDDASSPGATESEANVPQDVRNVFSESGEWAPSSFDHRHQVVASGSVDLPFATHARGVTAALFGGWRITGTLIAQSGAPFTVNLGVDRANIGAGPAQRPDAIGNPNLHGDQRNADRWFDALAFALPAQYTFGSARRNSVLGPAFSTVDVAIAKAWPLPRASRLEFRWEIFNLLNRTNFDLPNRVYGSPNFGRIFSAKPAREMQLGLRLSF